MWKIACILLGSGLLYYILKLSLYRRQISRLARQLRFHNENDSNVGIWIEVKTSEMVRLRDELEHLKQKYRENQIAFEESEAKRKRMIADISHDIRTPLTSIMGYVQMMNDCMDENEREHYQEIIEGRLNALSDMLEVFFDYTRINQGDQDAEKKIFDIRQILCEVLVSFYYEFEKQGIVPKISLPEEELCAYGDENVFQRIFYNLTKNALVHGKEEVCIQMVKEAEKIQIYFENKSSEELPENLQDVFERFYKSDRARKDSTSTGLGLCIVKELTENIGGSVYAYSNERDWFGIAISFNCSDLGGNDNAEDIDYRR